MNCSFVSHLTKVVRCQSV